MEIDYQQLVCSKKYQNRIKKRASEQQKLSALWGIFLRPSLVVADLGTHLPIHENPKSNFSHASSLDADDDIIAGTFDSSQWCLFSNPLSIPSFGPEYPKGEQAISDGMSFSKNWEPPSSRPTIGYFWAFTLEHDPDTPSGFEDQLDWVWAKSNGKQSALLQFDTFLRCNYKDYRGYNVTWAGNKSLHFHFIFNTTWLDKSALESWSLYHEQDPKHNLKNHYKGDMNPDVIWEYYKFKWNKLVNEFKSTTGIDVAFDASMKTLEHKRRLPWGTREELSDKNIHGFPKGSHIPQIVLAEKIFCTSPKNAHGHFLSTSEANSMTMPVAVAKTKPTITYVPPEVEVKLIAELTKYLKREWNSEYPKPSHFDNDLGVYFFIHASDVNPSTYLGKNYTRLLPSGKNAPSGNNIPHLPGYISLNDLLDNLLDLMSDQETEHVKYCTYSDIRRPKERAEKMPDHWFEYRARKAGRAAIRETMRSVAYDELQFSPYVCINSVEGIGKSYHILDSATSYRMDDLTEPNFRGRNLTSAPTGFQLFACSSYAQAEEQFLSYTSDSCGGLRTDRHGVLLKSFSQLYREYFSDPKNIARKDDRISYTDALSQGYTSLLDAVYNQQRDIYDEITRKKNEAWTIPPVAAPYKRCRAPEDSGFYQRFATVIFTAHETAQSFHIPTKSQAWLHPDFNYKEHGGSFESYEDLVKEFRVYRMIHDEISLDDLLWVASPEEIQFARKVKESGGESWSDMSMPDRLTAYELHKKSAPETNDTPMSFDRTLRVIKANFSNSDKVNVDFDALPYGTDNKDDGLYNGLTGNTYYIKEKAWWSECRARIIILTTERLPSRIIECLIWRRKTNKKKNEKMSEPVDDKFAVRWWDRDHLFQVDQIPLALDNRANKSDIQNLVNELLNPMGQNVDIVITNIANGSGVITHRSARGKNNLKDKSIATVLMYMGAAQYGQLNVISQKYGISDAIKLFYRDQFNQAIGRNRGFRRSNTTPADHKLIMSQKLYRELGGRDFFNTGRYQAYLTKV